MASGCCVSAQRTSGHHRHYPDCKALAALSGGGGDRGANSRPREGSAFWYSEPREESRAFLRWGRQGGGNRGLVFES